MSLLRKILGQTKSVAKPETVVTTGPRPAQPVFVVGDLHGHAKLLEEMLEHIDAVIGAEQLANPLLCFVGNLLDHGKDSAGAVRRMQELTNEFPSNVICLMGNHEQMLLEFLNAPRARHARWLREGGAETCRSFDIDVEGEEIDPEQADALAEALSTAMGQELLAWLAERPRSVRSGNVTVCHAGADPARPMDDQTDRVLIWGHPEFITRPRVDGEWIAHGHHVVERAQFGEGRISVNTEAWRTGLLSCAQIMPHGDVRFLEVGQRR